MNYYIFTVTDQENGGKKVPGIEIFNTRMKQSRWGLGERTPNRRKIVPGDRIIFYLGGISSNKSFIGTAVADSTAEEVEKDPIVPTQQTYYTLHLKNIEIWNNPKLISSYIGKLDFIQNPNNWGAYFQGGTRNISEKDFYAITEGVEMASVIEKTEEDISATTEFVLEKYLEEFIVSNWKKINFGKELEIFEDEDGNSGQQYLTDVGYIDILAIDKSGNFYVIELKKGRSSDQVVGQILRYVAWVKENLAKDKEVKGIIVVGDRDSKLEYSVKPVESIVKVTRYSIDFKIVEY